MSIQRIDLEEITNRVDELREARDDLQTTLDQSDERREYIENLTAWDEQNAEELAELEELLEELRGAGGGDHQWEGEWYPRELIDVDSFTEYAEELATECGMVNESASWPNNCIDWKRAARELSQDYSLVSFRGADYYWR